MHVTTTENVSISCLSALKKLTWWPLWNITHYSPSKFDKFQNANSGTTLVRATIHGICFSPLSYLQIYLTCTALSWHIRIPRLVKKKTILQYKKISPTHTAIGDCRAIIFQFCTIWRWIKIAIMAVWMNKLKHLTHKIPPCGFISIFYFLCTFITG